MVSRSLKVKSNYENKDFRLETKTEKKKEEELVSQQR